MTCPAWERRALEAVELNLLEGHLETHVVDGIKDGREGEIIEELMGLYGLANQIART